MAAARLTLLRASRSWSSALAATAAFRRGPSSRFIGPIALDARSRRAASASSGLALRGAWVIPWASSRLSVCCPATSSSRLSGKCRKKVLFVPPGIRQRLQQRRRRRAGGRRGVPPWRPWARNSPAAAAPSSRSRVRRTCLAASPPRRTSRGRAVMAVLGLASRGVRSTAVRMPRTVHNEGKGGFAGLLTEIARRTRVSGYPGDGAQRWPAVHALDAAVLLRLALELAPAGTSWHAVADEGDAVRDIAPVGGRPPRPPGPAYPAAGFVAQ